ncbi:MAG TPA: hypothetical protein VIU15_16275 [Streptomyces sp.]
MGTENGCRGSAPERSGEGVRRGDVVRDTGRDSVGEVMGFVGPYVQVRPVGGGVEWDARPELLRPASEAEVLSARVAVAKGRSRGERL